MNKKPIILVSGVNHSGTSMITKFLLDNGGVTGEWNKIKPNTTPFYKYEDRKFVLLSRSYIKNENIDKYKNNFKDHIKTFSDKKTTIFKYPKSSLNINKIIKVINDSVNREVKVIFPVRKINNVIDSNISKSKMDFDETYDFVNKVYQKIINCKSKVYMTFFERLLNHKDIKLLLEFCELPTNDINFSSIKKDKVNFK